MSRPGYTNLPPTEERTALFERLAAVMHLDAALHADRIRIINRALEKMDLAVTIYTLNASPTWRAAHERFEAYRLAEAKKRPPEQAAEMHEEHLHQMVEFERFWEFVTGIPTPKLEEMKKPN